MYHGKSSYLGMPAWNQAAVLRWGSSGGVRESDRSGNGGGDADRVLEVETSSPTTPEDALELTEIWEMRFSFTSSERRLGKKNELVK